jgi:membrane protease YdiL (CAAX protease family)
MFFRVADQDFIMKNSDSFLKRAVVFIFTIAVWWLTESRIRPLLGRSIQDLRNIFGNGSFVQNVLSQSLPVVIVCLLLFVLFHRAKIIPMPKFNAKILVIAREGFLWGLVICIPTVALALQMGYHIGFAPNWQGILGNIISNSYEEFVYRVFLLSVAAYAFKNLWAGVLVSAILFGIVHSQYPLSMQIIVVLAAVFFSMAYLRSKSIWSALLAHQISDMILDTILVQ